MSSTVEAIKKKFKYPSRFIGSTHSVWNEFTVLDIEYDPVNLGKGFPNFLPPPHIYEQLRHVATSADLSLQLPTESRGHPRLRKALSNLYSRLMKRQLNPDTELLITSGAYGSIYCAITSLVGPGDEVIVIEPYFDCYEPMTRVGGGIVRCVPLHKVGSGSSSNDYKWDEDHLRATFNDKTKMIVLNTPMNPLGKVFTEEELSVIAELCIKHNVICLSDEVYEWLVFEPAKHVKIATLPGMWERTITVGSAGKTLWVTGWKCGWSFAPSHLIDCMLAVHLSIVAAISTPTQEAIARSLEKEFDQFDSPECWFKVSNKMACDKRDYFLKLLSDTGFAPIVPDGGFFVVADWSNIGTKIDLSSEDSELRRDHKFARWMVKTIGLSSIPPSVFYSESNKRLGEDLIRFCFLKSDETLTDGAEVLRKLKLSIEGKEKQ